MRVRVTKRAQAQIDQGAVWWDENRELAPEAFDEDLAEAFSLLSVEPGIGAPVVGARIQGVRRLHLARIHSSSTTEYIAEKRTCCVFGTQVEVATRTCR